MYLFNNCLNVTQLACNYLLFNALGKVRFFIGGGGDGPGLRRGGPLVNFTTNWGGSNLFYSQRGEGYSFFGKKKITPCRFYFVYISKATSKD